MPPRELAPPLHWLPPILDNVSQTPTSNCSKGSRGLSVQPRVLGIFTETTVSPGPSKRQRPSRYAIRAGRNFASIPRFRGRRLSLHPGAVVRVSPQRRTVSCRPGSSSERVRRSPSSLPDLDAHRPLPVGRAENASKSSLLPDNSGNRSEVRDHAPEKILETPCLPLQRSVATIRPDAPASEVGLSTREAPRLGPRSG